MEEAHLAVDLDHDGRRFDVVGGEGHDNEIGFVREHAILHEPADLVGAKTGHAKVENLEGRIDALVQEALESGRKGLVGLTPMP